MGLPEESNWAPMKRRALRSLGSQKKRSITPAASAARRTVLLQLPQDDLEEGTLLRRPSERNKSPYVADVRLGDGRVAITHVPNLDMGGKCSAGARILMKRARDSKKQIVGASAVGKYGTPKCEFISQLLWVEEEETADCPDGGVWVGAHPSIGERIAAELISPSSNIHGNTAKEILGHDSKIKNVRKEVTGVAGCDMRSDFLVEHIDGSWTVVEVKSVVDSDYCPNGKKDEGCSEDAAGDQPGGGNKEKRGTKNKRSSNAMVRYYPTKMGKEYIRAGIFPWGRSNQKGPDGEPVVSARAIKHVSELTAVASGVRKDEQYPILRAAIIFVVIREDCRSFRPNHHACPTFARCLKKARDSGVHICAQSIAWGHGDNVGKAFAGPLLSIDFA